MTKKTVSSFSSLDTKRKTGLKILCFTLWDIKTTVWDTYFTVRDTKTAL